MIRKAEVKDLDRIMEIIKATIAEMKVYGNTQWDENYPQKNDFIGDVEGGSLYVSEENGELYGFICANFIEPDEYKDIKWASDEKCLILHRMSINPKYRNQGTATKLIEFAEKTARENGVNYIKTDTYSVNKKMNTLLLKLGYIHRGNMNFLGKEKEFYCYDKKI